MLISCVCVFIRSLTTLQSKAIFTRLHTSGRHQYGEELFRCSRSCGQRSRSWSNDYWILVSLRSL